jgi:LAO/AO transport system kinase
MSSNKNTGLKILKGVKTPGSINIKAVNHLKNKKSSDIPAAEYIKGILSGDRNLLSRAITIIESSLSIHQPIAQEIIEKCLPHSGNSLRIGITGIPGVGKSTFIEALGTLLINHGRKIAVLAVDPSSTRTKGSILGDKTRMIRLSSEENAFIRPSPAAGTLGGVARKTRETILLCEAAGYDTIIIETVGVGQSETVVHSMVDFFLVLMLAGTGDEIQGIKRGIMELADLILINKSDDSDLKKVLAAQRTFANALHFFPASESGWVPGVEYCSSVTLFGIQKAWDLMTDYFLLTKENGFFDLNRNNQARYWFYETINSEIKRSFYSNKQILAKLKSCEKAVVENRMSPFNAANQIIKVFSL